MTKLLPLAFITASVCATSLVYGSGEIETGFGAVDRSRLTAAVSVADSSLFANRLNLSLEDALRGQLAGVRIVTKDGQPGNSFDFLIRGTSTLIGSTTPLYVIDGLPMERLDVSPHDIESVTVLKDGASTALYGARGGNGVVVITTKRGIRGAPQVGLTINHSVQTMTRKISMMNSYQYQRARYDATAGFSPYEGPGSLPGGGFLSLDYNLFRDGYGNWYRFPVQNQWSNYADFADPSNPNYVNTDWTRDMLRNAMVQDYSLNVAGGNNKTLYRVMGGYFNQDGIVRGSGYRRWSARANVEQRLGRKVAVGANLSALYTVQKGSDYSGENGILMKMLSTPPTIPFTKGVYSYYDDNWETDLLSESPYSMSQNRRNDDIRRNIYARLYLNADITHSLKLTASANATFDKATQSENLSQNPLMPAGQIFTLTQDSRNRNRDYMADLMFNYAPFLSPSFELNLNAGGTIQYSKGDYRNDYLNITQSYSGYSSSERHDISDWNDFSDRALIAKGDFSYKKRYLLSASVRYEKLASVRNEWETYPALSAAWHVTNEKPFSGGRILSDLKVRWSTGKSATPFDSRVAISNSNSTNVFIWPNPGLKPENSTQNNLGLDFGMFSGRLRGTFDYYVKSTKNLLNYMPIPTPFGGGFDYMLVNMGSVKNRGVELTLDALMVRAGSFRWDVGLNIAHNRSKLSDSYYGTMILLSSPYSSGGMCAILQDGRSVGTWYGYQTAGIFSWNQIAALPNNYMSLGVLKDQMYPGFQRFVDQNGDNYIDFADQVPLGSAEPDFTGGMRNHFSYRNFALDLWLEFSKGGKVFNATRAYLSRPGGINNSYASAADYFRPWLFGPNTGNMVDAGNETASYPTVSQSSHTNYAMTSDKYIEDASYLRVSDISLSYSLGQRALRAIRARNITIFVSVKNAFLFTAYKGYDPDVSTSGYAYMPGLDWTAYPRARTYTLGLSMTF